MGDSRNHHIAIGIDLGMTKTCIAYYENGTTKIVKNKDGSRVMSPFVFADNDQSTEFGLKNLFCDQCSDHVLDLCADFFKEMKSNIEQFLSVSVSNVAIAIPTCTTYQQRCNLLKSANSAGFNVLLVDEAAAAASAFYFSSKNHAEYSLIFDFGASKCTATILQKSATALEVITSRSDTNLGGENFDEIIKKYVCDLILKKHGSFPQLSRISSQRLKNKCENAKKILSTRTESVIEFDEFAHISDVYEINLMRKKFEEISDSLLQRAMGVLDQCVQDSKLPKKSIRNIILCGGTSRIPKIRDMVSDYFNGRSLNRFMNPEECIAEGAAWMGYKKSKLI